MTKARSVVSKCALVVMVLGAVTWLGGINVRASVGFSLLQFGTLEFKPNIDPGIERAVFSLVAQSSMILNSAYAVVLVATIPAGVVAKPHPPLKPYGDGGIIFTIRSGTASSFGCIAAIKRRNASRCSAGATTVAGVWPSPRSAKVYSIPPIAFVAASMLVVALPITDELGFGLAALVLGWHIWRSRRVQELTV